MGHSLGRGLRGWAIFFFFFVSDKTGEMSLIPVFSQKLFFNNAVSTSLPFLQETHSLSKLKW